MGLLASRVKVSPEARVRLNRVAGIAMAFVAAVSWWFVFEDGPSTAKVLAAAASTAAAVLQFVRYARERKAVETERRPD